MKSMLVCKTLYSNIQTLRNKVSNWFCFHIVYHSLLNAFYPINLQQFLRKFYAYLVLNDRKHEWDKHGTCAASLPALNSEHKYFAKGLEFNRKWNLTKYVKKLQ